MVGFFVFNVETSPFGFPVDRFAGVKRHDIGKKAEVLFFARRLYTVAFLPDALGREAFETGHQDMFQRPYLSFRSGSDHLGSPAGPINQTYPLVTAMAYGI